MNESSVKINSSFVSERINKIRFVSGELNQEPNLFLSGSDDSANNIKLWTLKRNEFADEAEFIPKATAKLSVDGEVTGLEIIDHNNFAVSSGSGVSLIYINRDQERDNLKENARFINIHKFSTGDPALCTGISNHDENICSIGEDGRIVVISGNSSQILNQLEKTDSVTQTAVKFVSHKELITGNRFGIMKSFDLRSGSNEPTATFTVSCEDEKKCNAVTCITYHPSQRHIVSSLKK